MHGSTGPRKTNPSRKLYKRRQGKRLHANNKNIQEKLKSIYQYFSVFASEEHLLSEKIPDDLVNEDFKLSGKDVNNSKTDDSAGQASTEKEQSSESGKNFFSFFARAFSNQMGDASPFDMSELTSTEGENNPAKTEMINSLAFSKNKMGHPQDPPQPIQQGSISSEQKDSCAQKIGKDVASEVLAKPVVPQCLLNTNKKDAEDVTLLFTSSKLPKCPIPKTYDTEDQSIQKLIDKNPGVQYLNSNFFTNFKKGKTTKERTEGENNPAKMEMIKSLAFPKNKMGHPQYPPQSIQQESISSEQKDSCSQKIGKDVASDVLANPVVPQCPLNTNKKDAADGTLLFTSSKLPKCPIPKTYDTEDQSIQKLIDKNPGVQYLNSHFFTNFKKGKTTKERTKQFHFGERKSLSITDEDPLTKVEEQSNGNESSEQKVEQSTSFVSTEKITSDKILIPIPGFISNLLEDKKKLHTTDVSPVGLPVKSVAKDHAGKVNSFTKIKNNSSTSPEKVELLPPTNIESPYNLTRIPKAMRPIKPKSPMRVRSPVTAKKAKKEKTRQKLRSPDIAVKKKSSKANSPVKSFEKAKSPLRVKSQERAKSPLKVKSLEKAKSPLRVKSAEKVTSPARMEHPNTVKSGISDKSPDTGAIQISSETVGRIKSPDDLRSKKYDVTQGNVKHSDPEDNSKMIETPIITNPDTLKKTIDESRLFFEDKTNVNDFDGNKSPASSSHLMSKLKPLTKPKGTTKKSIHSSFLNLNRSMGERITKTMDHSEEAQSHPDIDLPKDRNSHKLDREEIERVAYLNANLFSNLKQKMNAKSKNDQQKLKPHSIHKRLPFISYPKTPGKSTSFKEYILSLGTRLHQGVGAGLVLTEQKKIQQDKSNKQAAQELRTEENDSSVRNIIELIKDNDTLLKIDEATHAMTTPQKENTEKMIEHLSFVTIADESKMRTKSEASGSIVKVCDGIEKDPLHNAERQTESFRYDLKTESTESTSVANIETTKTKDKVMDTKTEDTLNTQTGDKFGSEGERVQKDGGLADEVRISKDLVGVSVLNTKMHQNKNGIVETEALLVGDKSDMKAIPDCVHKTPKDISSTSADLKSKYKETENELGTPDQTGFKLPNTVDTKMGISHYDVPYKVESETKAGRRKKPDAIEPRKERIIKTKIVPSDQLDFHHSEEEVRMLEEVLDVVKQELTIELQSTDQLNALNEAVDELKRELGKDIGIILTPDERKAFRSLAIKSDIAKEATLDSFRSTTGVNTNDKKERSEKILADSNVINTDKKHAVAECDLKSIQLTNKTSEQPVSDLSLDEGVFPTLLPSDEDINPTAKITLQTSKDVVGEKTNATSEPNVNRKPLGIKDLKGEKVEIQDKLNTWKKAASKKFVLTGGRNNKPLFSGTTLSDAETKAKNKDLRKTPNSRYLNLLSTVLGYQFNTDVIDRAEEIENQVVKASESPSDMATCSDALTEQCPNELPLFVGYKGLPFGKKKHIIQTKPTFGKQVSIHPNAFLALLNDRAEVIENQVVKASESPSNMATCSDALTEQCQNELPLFVGYKGLPLGKKKHIIQTKPTFGKQAPASIHPNAFLTLINDQQRKCDRPDSESIESFDMDINSNDIDSNRKCHLSKIFPGLMDADPDNAYQEGNFPQELQQYHSADVPDSIACEINALSSLNTGPFHDSAEKDDKLFTGEIRLTNNTNNIPSLKKERKNDESSFLVNSDYLHDIPEKGNLPNGLKSVIFHDLSSPNRNETFTRTLSTMEECSFFGGAIANFFSDACKEEGAAVTLNKGEDNKENIHDRNLKQGVNTAKNSKSSMKNGKAPKRANTFLDTTRGALGQSLYIRNELERFYGERRMPEIVKLEQEVKEQKRINMKKAERNPRSHSPSNKDKRPITLDPSNFENKSRQRGNNFNTNEGPVDKNQRKMPGASQNTECKRYESISRKRVNRSISPENEERNSSHRSRIESFLRDQELRKLRAKPSQTRAERTENLLKKVQETTKKIKERSVQQGNMSSLDDIIPKTSHNSTRTAIKCPQADALVKENTSKGQEASTEGNDQLYSQSLPNQGSMFTKKDKNKSVSFKVSSIDRKSHFSRVIKEKEQIPSPEDVIPKSPQEVQIGTLGSIKDCIYNYLVEWKKKNDECYQYRLGHKDVQDKDTLNADQGDNEPLLPCHTEPTVYVTDSAMSLGNGTPTNVPSPSLEADKAITNSDDLAAPCFYDPTANFKNDVKRAFAWPFGKHVERENTDTVDTHANEMDCSTESNVDFRNESEVDSVACSHQATKPCFLPTKSDAFDSVLSTDHAENLMPCFLEPTIIHPDNCASPPTTAIADSHYSEPSSKHTVPCFVEPTSIPLDSRGPEPTTMSPDPSFLEPTTISQSSCLQEPNTMPTNNGEQEPSMIFAQPCVTQPTIVHSDPDVPENVSTPPDLRFQEPVTLSSDSSSIDHTALEPCFLEPTVLPQDHCALDSSTTSDDQNEQSGFHALIDCVSKDIQEPILEKSLFTTRNSQAVLPFPDSSFHSDDDFSVRSSSVDPPISNGLTLCADTAISLDRTQSPNMTSSGKGLESMKVEDDGEKASITASHNKEPVTLPMEVSNFPGNDGISTFSCFEMMQPKKELTSELISDKPSPKGLTHLDSRDSPTPFPDEKKTLVAETFHIPQQTIHPKPVVDDVVAFATNKMNDLGRKVPPTTSSNIHKPSLKSHLLDKTPVICDKQKHNPNGASAFGGLKKGEEIMQSMRKEDVKLHPDCSLSPTKSISMPNNSTFNKDDPLLTDVSENDVSFATDDTQHEAPEYPASIVSDLQNELSNENIVQNGADVGNYNPDERTLDQRFRQYLEEQCHSIDDSTHEGDKKISEDMEILGTHAGEKAEDDNENPHSKWWRSFYGSRREKSPDQMEKILQLHSSKSTLTYSSTITQARNALHRVKRLPNATSKQPTPWVKAFQTKSMPGSVQPIGHFSRKIATKNVSLNRANSDHTKLEYKRMCEPQSTPCNTIDNTVPLIPNPLCRKPIKKVGALSAVKKDIRLAIELEEQIVQNLERGKHLDDIPSLDICRLCF